MGTNFYCRHIPTESEHLEMQEMLTNKQYEKLKKFINETTFPYHIGKRSCGWQFLFQANDEKVNPNNRIEWDEESLVPWDATLESLTEYLKRDDIQIYDEYGEEFTFDQFWNEEVGESLYNDEKHINIEQYYKNNPNSYKSPNETQFEKDGIRFETRWFS